MALASPHPKGGTDGHRRRPQCQQGSLLLDIAARVSTGRGMPDRERGRGGVLLLLGEDSVQKTVIQRLTAAGADLGQIAVLNRSVILPRDLALVEETACQIRAKLILIDPIMAFLGADSNNDQKVRGALTPLREIAERTDISVVMVRHLNKRGGRHALYRGSGSIGLVAATRSALLVGRSPDDPDLRVLCQTKSNLGPLAPGLLFEPVSSPEGVVVVEWRGKCAYTPEDLLGPPQSGGGRQAEAMAFLNNLLSTGPVEQRAVKVKSVEAGLAYRTVERQGDPRSPV